jgi:cyclic lactone autoinducer peptide
MKKKGNVNDAILKAVERIARNEVEKNCFDWPPDCMGIFHQPKRPKNVKKENSSL